MSILIYTLSALPVAAEMTIELGLLSSAPRISLENHRRKNLKKKKNINNEISTTKHRSARRASLGEAEGCIEFLLAFGVKEFWG